MLSKITKSVMLKSQLRQFSSNTNKYHVDLNQKYVAHNYSSYPIATVKGEGSYIWDIEGRKYHDWMVGFGACNQGHCHPEIVKALVNQAQRLTHTSRAVYND